MRVKEHQKDISKGLIAISDGIYQFIISIKDMKKNTLPFTPSSLPLPFLKPPG
jgi:hypothetical protein